MKQNNTFFEQTSISSSKERKDKKIIIKLKFTNSYQKTKLPTVHEIISS
jgi:hypothetical protein